MNRNVAVVVALLQPIVLQFGLATAAQARPSFATENGNSCRDGCHANEQVGRMSVTGEDTTLDLGTQLDGNMRGPLKTFVTMPGEIVTLQVEVLDGSPVFAVQLKRLETGGQLNDLGNFLVWTEANDGLNPWTLQEVTNPPYFTKDDGSNGGLDPSEAGIFSFDLEVDVSTPPDVYDLEFAVAGGAMNWYQDEHFYLEVPEPDPALLWAAAVALMPVLLVIRRLAGPRPH